MAGGAEPHLDGRETYAFGGGWNGGRKEGARKTGVG